MIGPAHPPLTDTAPIPVRTHVLYVGGLPKTFEDQDLRALLAPFGAIAHATLVRRTHSTESAGFGFVHMYSRAQALTAARTLEGTTLQGQRLRLYVTREERLASPPGVLMNEDRP